MVAKIIPEKINVSMLIEDVAKRKIHFAMENTIGHDCRVVGR